MKNIIIGLFLFSVSAYALDLNGSRTDLSGQTLKVSSITASDSTGLMLSDDANNGIFIQDGGKVGIGTVKPAAPLHIKGPGDSADTLLLKLDEGSYGSVEFTHHYIAPGRAGLIIGRASGGVSTLYIDAGNGTVGIFERAPAERLQISTSSTSGYSLGFAGAYNSLPTSGHEEGTMVYILSDHTLYISTETVVGVQSWKPVW